MVAPSRPARLKQSRYLRAQNVAFDAVLVIDATLDTVRTVAETGVDCISVGALTHSARSLDVSQEVLA